MIGTAEEFRDLIEMGLARQVIAKDIAWRADHPNGKTNPSCTDAGKACDRQVYFSLRNVPPSDPVDSASLVNFGVGHAVENWLAETLEASGSKVERERRVEIPFPSGVGAVTGRVDFLVTPSGQPFYKPAGDPLPVELKSTSSKAAAFMPKGGRPEHRSQLNLYLHALGLSTGMLVYVVKDAAKGKENVIVYRVAHDPNLAAEHIRHLDELATAAAAKQDPGRPSTFTASKFPCSYCDFRTLCWKG